jgi:hypothetical protein
LIAKISNQRPLGKSARSAVYQALDKLYQAIPVAPGRYGWLSVLLKDQYFRHPLTKIEIRQGYLLLDELEHAVFFPQFFQTHEDEDRRITIELMGGPELTAHATIKQGTWSLSLGDEFGKWVNQVGGAASDDLLIWVEDAIRGVYSVRLQPREARDEEYIKGRNFALADLAEQLIANDRKMRVSVPTWELAAKLIGRGFFSDPIPPDDMHYVLHEYSALRLHDDMGYARGDGENVYHSSAWNTEEPDTYSARTIRSDNVGGLAPWGDVDGFAGADSFVDESEFGSLTNLEPDESLAADLWEDWQSEDFEGIFGDELFSGAKSLHDDTSTTLCEGYQFYLNEFREQNSAGQPLTHGEFHLLEAELEMLVSLEIEFGFLMPEQEKRKLELAERLFMDPNFFFGGDSDYPDLDDPPFWDN